LIFGSKVFEERINDFKSGMERSDDVFLYSTVLIPMIITGVILLLQPILQRFHFIYTEWNKSEGLKKRDQFSSETMLTLEQSNELRSSVQKVQQFHQEVLKNKDEEIVEYKKLVTLKEEALVKQDANNLGLIEKASQEESEKSELATEVANQKIEKLKFEENYKRLSEIFSKQREKQISLRNKFNADRWFANKKLVAEFPKLINFGDDYNLSENVRFIGDMLSISSTQDWIDSCHRLIIEGFSNSWSFNMSDAYFDKLIRPYLSSFNTKNLEILTSRMKDNNQINSRNRAESDLLEVNDAVTLKAA
jgi:hypothetical protein